MKVTDKIELLNVDCLSYMATVPDKFFDLAIVDPPYGIDRANNTVRVGKNKSRVDSYIKRTDYGGKMWDSKCPDQSYFTELIRVSKNQIIWGANHFISKIPFDSPCWIIWDKVDALPTYASGEMAWTSFDSPMKIVALRHSGFKRGETIGRESKIKYNIPFSGPMDIHPTQKPVALYNWLLKNYAKEGDKILDTHGGSMSIALACHDYKYDLTLCEIDKDYFEAGLKRLKNHVAQTVLF